LKVINRNIGDENVVAGYPALTFRVDSSKDQGKIVHGGNFMPAKKKAAKKKKH
jgi:hypothetical protein